ncbi:hypothetical protein ACROYT_G014195 [Oculina patagonica]
MANSLINKDEKADEEAMVRCAEETERKERKKKREVRRFQHYSVSEKNGRLLLRASHAANDGYNSVLVYSEDTDVFIMSLALSNEIGASLFMKSGTHAQTKVIDITKVAASLDSEVCKGVLGVYDSLDATLLTSKPQILWRSCGRRSCSIGRLLSCSSQETKEEFNSFSPTRLGNWEPQAEPTEELRTLISSPLKTAKSKAVICEKQLIPQSTFLEKAEFL